MKSDQLAHDIPMSLLDAGIADCRDERHVDLELLKLALDGSGGPHRSLELWMGEQFRQLVGSLPQVLNLENVNVIE